MNKQTVFDADIDIFVVTSHTFGHIVTLSGSWVLCKKSVLNFTRQHTSRMNTIEFKSIHVIYICYLILKLRYCNSVMNKAFLQDTSIL